MAHDGADPTLGTGPVLDGLLGMTAAALPHLEELLAQATAAVRTEVSEAGKVSAARLELRQSAAHGLAWLATYVEALRQMQGWAERLDGEGQFGEMERLLLQIGFGEY